MLVLLGDDNDTHLQAGTAAYYYLLVILAIVIHSVLCNPAIIQKKSSKHRNRPLK